MGCRRPGAIKRPRRYLGGPRSNDKASQTIWAWRASWTVGLVATLFATTVQAREPSLRLAAVGDLLFDRAIRGDDGRADPRELLSAVRTIFASHDLTVGNLECPLSPSEVGYQLPKRFSFRCDPEVAKGLRAADLDLITVANNHSIDRGRQGLLYTLETLRRQGMRSIGGGENQAAALRPVVVRHEGLRVAFVGALGFLLEAMTRLEDRPAPAWDLQRLLANIATLRNQVDLVVAVLHWGPEGLGLPSARQIDLGHRLIDAGADLVIGAHPHVLQSVERYKGRWIVYSLGNFVFDNPGLWQRRSAVLSCTLRRGGLDHLEMLPVELKKHRPRPVRGPQARQIQRRLSSLSRAYGVRAALRRGTIELRPQRPREPPSTQLLRRWRPRGARHLIEVYSDRLVLRRPGEETPTATLPMGESRRMIRDAALSVALPAPATSAYVFAIVGPLSARWGERLAVFSLDLDRGRFGPPLLDSHGDFRPWRVQVGDLDADGEDELLVGVYKSTHYESKRARRLFVFRHDHGHLQPLWLGSRLPAPLLDFATLRRHNTRRSTLITWGPGPAGSPARATRLRWTGFGFDRPRPLVISGEPRSLVEALYNLGPQPRDKLRPR